MKIWETYNPAVGNHRSVVLVKMIINNYQEHPGLPTNDVTLMKT